MDEAQARPGAQLLRTMRRAEPDLMCFLRSYSEFESSPKAASNWSRSSCSALLIVASFSVMTARQCEYVFLVAAMRALMRNSFTSARVYKAEWSVEKETPSTADASCRRRHQRDRCCVGPKG